jgi:hypothetical protein
MQIAALLIGAVFGLWCLVGYARVAIFPSLRLVSDNDIKYGDEPHIRAELDRQYGWPWFQMKREVWVSSKTKGGELFWVRSDGKTCSGTMATQIWNLVYVSRYERDADPETTESP